MAMAILQASASFEPTTKEDFVIADAYMDKCLEEASIACAHGAVQVAEKARHSSQQSPEDQDAINKIKLLGRDAMDPLDSEKERYFPHSRCNPENMSEVQSFDGKQWIYRFACKSPELCKAFERWVTCKANDTANRSIDNTPIITEKKCSPQNESETLAWNGTHWNFDGVCLPPYVCHDFDGAASFAFCSDPEAINKHIWLPWPTLNIRSQEVYSYGRQNYTLDADLDFYTDTDEDDDDMFPDWFSGQKGEVMPDQEATVSDSEDSEDSE